MPQVKTFSQAVSDTVTVHWPLQCQVEIPDLSSITRLCFVNLRKFLKEEHRLFVRLYPRGLITSWVTLQNTIIFVTMWPFAEGIPPSVEMFFNPTGHEALIQPIGRDFGEVVYRDGHHFCLAELWCLLIFMCMSKIVVSCYWWFWWRWCWHWILAKWQAQGTNESRRSLPISFLTASAFHK